MVGPARHTDLSQTDCTEPTGQRWEVPEGMEVQGCC